MTFTARIDHDRLLDRRAERTNPALWSARSRSGMVAAPHYLATAAGAEMLALGGNAFDAALAASMTLGVCEPAGSGLGGMGMMVLHHAAAQQTMALAAPCRAPAEATPEAVLASDRYRGYRAVAVPTLVALWDRVAKSLCRLPLAKLLAPAIELAHDGVRVTPLQHKLIGTYRKALRASQHTAWLFDGDGNPLEIGATVRQPALAATLERLAKAGLQDFYRGEIARQIDADMTAHGGFLRLRDLQEVPDAMVLPTLPAPWAGGVVHTVGPPAGGLALAQMLHIYDALRATGAEAAPDSPEGAVLLAKVIRQARSDRRRLSRAVGSRDLGRAGELLEESYNRQVAGRLQEAGETAHISVMDDEGNAVSLTQSIERSFGAAEMSPQLGFLYNGYLRAFKVKNKAHPHFLRPGAEARSNASPAIVMRDDRATAAIGCTGSERMASSMFLALVRLGSQEPFTAVHAPRLHCTPEGLVLCEGDRMEPSILHALARSGFTTDILEPYAFKTGGMQLVVCIGDALVGVGDPRRDGAASSP